MGEERKGGRAGAYEWLGDAGNARTIENRCRATLFRMHRHESIFDFLLDDLPFVYVRERAGEKKELYERILQTRRTCGHGISRGWGVYALSREGDEARVARGGDGDAAVARGGDGDDMDGQRRFVLAKGTRAIGAGDEGGAVVATLHQGGEAVDALDGGGDVTDAPDDDEASRLAYRMVLRCVEWDADRDRARIEMIARNAGPASDDPTTDRGGVGAVGAVGAGRNAYIPPSIRTTNVVLDLASGAALRRHMRRIDALVRDGIAVRDVEREGWPFADRMLYRLFDWGHVQAGWPPQRGNPALEGELDAFEALCEGLLERAYDEVDGIECDYRGRLDAYIASVYGHDG